MRPADADADLSDASSTGSEQVRASAAQTAEPGEQAEPSVQEMIDHVDPSL